VSGGAAVLPAGSGTPKMGTDCRVCDDRGTIVVEEHGTPVREEVCPADCEAAERIRASDADLRS
jgi:hypothetical protein